MKNRIRYRGKMKTLISASEKYRRKIKRRSEASAGRLAEKVRRDFGIVGGTLEGLSQREIARKRGVSRDVVRYALPKYGAD